MDLLDILSDQIKTELTASIKSVKDSTVRLSVEGLPREILKKLLDRYIESDGIPIQINGNNDIVGVLLLDSTMKFGPESKKSGICHPDFAVSRRGGQNLVVLVPIDQYLNRSMDTSVTSFGVREDTIRGKRSIRKDPFFKNILAQLKKYLSISDSTWKSLEKVLQRSITDREQLGDKIGQNLAWDLVDDLSRVDTSQPGWVHEFLGICGYPIAPENELGTKRHLSTLKKLIGYMGNNGFLESRDLLKTEAGQELEKPIEDLFLHLSTKCDTIADFEECPSLYFSPLGKSNQEIPNWFHTLDSETILELIQDTGTSDKRKLKVKCLNDIKFHYFNKLVVQDIPEFSVPDQEDIPVESKVSVSVGGSQLAELHSPIESWSPASVPSHGSHVEYEFSIVDEPELNESLKVISLNNYDPGFLVDCSTAEKNIRSIKKVKSEDKIWEVDVYLEGIGIHDIKIYSADSLECQNTAYLEDASSETSEPEEVELTKTSKGYYLGTVDTDEESIFKVHFTGKAGINKTLRINLYAKEKEVKGVQNEFERLVLENAGNKSPVINIDWNNFLPHLELKLLGSRNSCYPLIISEDYNPSVFTEEIDWKNRPKLTQTYLPNDPRPGFEDWGIPDSYLEARGKVLRVLNNQINETDKKLLEDLRLGIPSEELDEAITGYLKEYYAWLEKAPTSATLSDTILVHPSNGANLELRPTAIIVTPLHPVKLSWQRVAQRTLFNAIDSNRKCPAASILNPDSVPDHIELMLINQVDDKVPANFISVESDSPYWAVLWNKDRLNDLFNISSKGIWSSKFGLKVGSTTAGFSAAQMKRAISDARQIHMAKSRLTISLAENTGSMSSANDGIMEWCRENFSGQGQKELIESGPWGLDILDFRNPQAKPTPQILANLSTETDASVRWYSKWNNGHTQQGDLSIVEHFRIENPDLEEEQELASPFTDGGLVRRRIRNVINTNAAENPIRETRVGKYYGNIENTNSLRSLVTSSIQLLETSRSSQGSPSRNLIFTPSTSSLIKQFNHSRYCAISSSSVDISSFTNRGDNRFLWDYDLPSYGNISGENFGFYMLVQENETIINTVKNAVRHLIEMNVEIDTSQTSKLLNEVSRRGIPTLKKLASGGSGSLGEIGVIIALKLLQDDFITGEVPGSIVPLYEQEDGQERVTLVVPIDPFKDQFEALMDAAGPLREDYLSTWSGKKNRADLLVLSVLFGEDERPINLKITPVEVKTRTSQFGGTSVASALKQASDFGEFLFGLSQIPPISDGEIDLWNVASKELLSSFISFGFSIAGTLEDIQGKRGKWAKLHQNTIGYLFSGHLDLTIDTKGRLVIVDQSEIEKFDSRHHADDFNEIIYVGSRNYKDILLDEHHEFATRLISKISNWDLQPAFGIQEPKKELKPKVTQFQEPKETKEESIVGEPQGQEFEPEHMEQTGHTQGQGTESGQSNNKPIEIEESMDQGTDYGDGVKFKVGATLNELAPQDKYYWPSNTKLNQLNTGIVGDLGTGKTQLVQSLIYKLSNSADDNLSQRPKFLIFDYKGDYNSGDFVEETGAKVVEPNNIPLNLFDTSMAEGAIEPWVQRNKFFTDVLNRIYSGIGNVQQYNIRNAIKRSYENADLQGHDYPLLEDIQQAYFNEIDGKADSVLNILTHLMDLKVFSSNREEIVPFPEFFDGVVVINLARLGSDDKSKNLLVAIFLNLFFEYMLKIEGKDFRGEAPQLRKLDSFLLVDEADNIMQYEFEVLNKILLQGRQFGVGVLLASQYLSHFKTSNKDYREPLLTWFLHKVPNISRRELEAIGLTDVAESTIDRIKNLEVHQCLYKSLGSDGEFIRGEPFYEIYQE